MYGELLLKENLSENMKFKAQMYLVEAHLANMNIKSAN